MHDDIFQDKKCDDSIIWDIFLSAYKYPALVAADKIGLFALLQNGGLTAEALGKSLAIQPRGLEALLATLASLHLIHVEHGVYSLADVARLYLLPKSSFYWGHMFHFDEGRPVTPLGLLEDLKRQTPRAYVNTDLWKDHEANREHAVNFTKAMHSHSFPSAIELACRFDFSEISRLLDVGGGSGCFSIALALRWKNIRCVVAERPYVCKVADDYIASFRVSDRVQTVVLDMFEDRWPTDCDAVFMSNLLHDWDEAKCRRLINSAFACLPKGGSLFIHEMLLDDSKNGPWPTAAFSLTMLRFTEGQQYSFAQLKDLLEQAGFIMIEAKPAAGSFALITAKRPK